MVPLDASGESISNFQFGGIYPFDKSALLHTNVLPILNESRPVVVENILKHLESGPDKRVIFADFVASPDDKSIKTSGLEYNWFNGGEVYYLVACGDPDKAKIEMTLRASESHAFLCVLSNLQADEYSKVEPFTEINSNLLKALARNVSEFFVAAYDHEGFLKWERGVNSI